MPECPFCSPKRAFLLENSHAFAIEDGYPVSQGHSLIIPKSHTESFFDLPGSVRAGCLELLADLRTLLEQMYRADGFNVGINCGEAAGQTISHAHIHLIPRYAGDVRDPRGGVRNVIPEKGPYS